MKYFYGVEISNASLLEQRREELAMYGAPNVAARSITRQIVEGSAIDSAAVWRTLC